LFRLVLETVETEKKQKLAIPYIIITILIFSG